MIMQGNVPTSMNNIWAKNQTASGRNEFASKWNNKGTNRKPFRYRNDVSLKLRIDNSYSMIMQGNVPSSMNNI
jgi:head-tail adaptor